MASVLWPTRLTMLWKGSNKPNPATILFLSLFKREIKLLRLCKEVR